MGCENGHYPTESCRWCGHNYSPIKAPPEGSTKFTGHNVVTLLLVALILIIAGAIGKARGAEYGAPDEGAYYKSLFQPDNGTSCCGDGDAYYADKVDVCGPHDEVLDDKNDSFLAEKAARQIASRNEAVAVLGHIFMENTVPAARIYKEAGIPMVTGMTGAAEVTARPDSERITARSTVFCSSRTLPGQRYSSSAACAESEKPVTFTPCFRVKRRRK